jgi:hypothetical protein
MVEARTENKGREISLPQLPGQSKLLPALGIITLVAVLGGFLFLAWHNWSRPALTDYEGIIIDRWAAHNQSQEGSTPYFRLVIETEKGERTTVRVDVNTYDRAKVGMRITSRSGHVELAETPRRNPTP